MTDMNEAQDRPLKTVKLHGNEGILETGSDQDDEKNNEDKMEWETTVFIQDGK